MTERTCARTACDEAVSTLPDEYPYCSDVCKRISNAVYGEPQPGPFSWLGAS